MTGITDEEIYFEIELDALDEAEGDEDKARALLKNPEWIRKEAHDVAKRQDISEERVCKVMEGIL